MHRSSYDFAELAERHRNLTELSCDHSVAVAFEGPKGSALGLGDRSARRVIAPSGLMARLGDYPEVFQTAFGDRRCGGGRFTSAHLRIYGPLEARLTQSDRVIIGGTGRRVWATGTREAIPWVSRPSATNSASICRTRRIGLSAHDFAQCSAPTMSSSSHAAKVGGAPAVRRASCTAGSGGGRGARKNRSRGGRKKTFASPVELIGPPSRARFAQRRQRRRARSGR